MADRKILSGLVRDLCVRVDERRVRIVQDVGVGLVLHHDEENMIELAESAAWSVLIVVRRARVEGRSSRDGYRRQKSQSLVVHAKWPRVVGKARIDTTGG